MDYVILGCGYTGRRVAGALLKRGNSVTLTTRNPDSLADLAALGATVVPLDLALPFDLRFAPPGCAILHSIPPVRVESNPLMEALPARASRVVYLSSTAVYGQREVVDEHTLPSPQSDRDRLRLAAEDALKASMSSWLILRPAAIYGPDRGVHRSIQESDYRIPAQGLNYISRIHVEDLAAISVAGLDSGLTGAFPVADDEPCTSGEIAAFCASLLKIPLPQTAAHSRTGDTRIANRRVNGGEIRRRLHIALRYPSYRQGIPAALGISGEKLLTDNS